MVVALIKGDVDAFIVFEPSPSIVRKELGEDKVTVFAPNNLYGETWNIVVKKDFEEQNPITIKRFLGALIKAEAFKRENPEESLEIVSKLSETDTNILIDMMKKQRHGVVLNKLLTKQLSKEAEWAIEQGLSTNKDIPDYDEYINPGHLRGINPKRVTI